MIQRQKKEYFKDLIKMQKEKLDEKKNSKLNEIINTIYYKSR